MSIPMVQMSQQKLLTMLPFFSLKNVNADFKYKHHWVSSPKDVKIAYTIKVFISLTSLMNIEYIITSLIDMDAFNILIN